MKYTCLTSSVKDTVIFGVLKEDTDCAKALVLLRRARPLHYGISTI